MKKILFISPRNPFLGRYSGDVIRAKKFVNFFEKKHQTTVVTIDKFHSSRKVGKIKLINTKSMAFLSETKKKPAIISRLF